MDQSNRSHFVNWYDNQTFVDPEGLAVFLLLAAVMLFVRRGAAIVPLLLVVSLLSTTQRVVVGSLDFPYMRLMLVVAGIRILARGEWRPLRLHMLDKVFILSILTAATISALRIGTIDKVVHRLGWSFDAIGLYLACRVFLRGWSDLDQFAKWVSITAAALAPLFIVEWQTGHNYFSLLGGIPEITGLHHGRVRASGSYAHSILAGCFWLTLLPLIVVRFWNPRASKTLAAAGTLGALSIIVACASSTPLLGLIMGIGATFLFPIRRSLRWVRWGVAVLLVTLHIVMDAPVWHLIARLNVIAGSSGWHRFNLIDQFIRHFDEWWLFGTSYTGHWGNNLIDVTNVYVLQGVRGGLLNLSIYIAMLTLAFRRVGLVYRGAEGDRTRLAYGWALGIALFSNAVVQMAVSFYGEILFAYYGIIAAIASMPLAMARAPAPARARAPAPERPEPAPSAQPASASLGAALVGQPRPTSR